MLKNLVNLSLIFLCTSLDISSSTQYCNKSIVTQKIIKEQQPYMTKELYQKQCPFTTVEVKCPFWRNVTKYETVDKVISEEHKFVVCCEGYFLKNNQSCLPLCKDQCINGNCTAPDECTCWEGYNKSPDRTNVCNPFCASCDNGDCIEPNKCQCHKGYVEDPETHICEPFCGDDKCGFGHCQEPYNCKCDAGYEKDRNGRCTIKSCASECNGGNCRDGNCECPIGAEWADKVLSCVCPTLLTTPEFQTQTETSTIPDMTPSTITEASTSTETVESPTDASSGYHNDLLIKGLSGIIVILLLTIFTILTIIWWEKRKGSQNYNSNYTMRYQTDQVLIQPLEKC